MQKKSFPLPSTTAVSQLLPDGRIVELVYLVDQKKTMIAVSDGKESVLVEKLRLETGEHLVPLSASNNLIKHQVLLLPEKPESYGSVAQLIKDIQTYLHRYIDFTPEFEQIASYYVLMSWVYDAFSEVPYLRLRGDFGSGKTRALLVIGSICYKAFFASGASTVSPIFHTLDTFRGTLVFDEADFRFSDEKAELVKIFNNGNVRGFPVLRTAFTAKKEFDPRAFAVFGPKIVGMRQAFQDVALESRFITEEMGQKTLRADIPINLPPAQKDEALNLRNKLLAYRFENRHRIKIDDSLVDPSLSPRLNQILIPLLSIIESEEVRVCVRDAAAALEQNLRAERSTSPEAGLLEVLAELLTAASGPTIAVAEITAAFTERFSAEFERPITHRYIGHLLRTRLRLFTYKRHGTYVLPTTEKVKIELLCKRYGVDRGLEDAA